VQALVYSSVFPALSCTSFKVSNLILSSLIHIGLILVQDDRHGSSFNFRNSKTMLNKSGDSLNICLVPDFRRNVFSFFPLLYCWL
jgi:hypothetical protein